jgi:hypothetical protein
VLYAFARLMHLASIAICLVVIASFALFVTDQTSTASAHQQRLLNGELSPEAQAPAAGTAPEGTGAGGGGAGGRSSRTGSAHEGGVRKAIDDAANELTSPFSGTVSSSSEWTTRIVKLALTLVVYGFGLGFLARVVRVRV